MVAIRKLAHPTKAYFFNFQNKKYSHHEEHEGHEEWNLMNCLKGLLDVQLRSTVEDVKGIHEAQLLTYMKLASVNKGLLINFNVKKLREGLKRFVI